MEKSSTVSSGIGDLSETGDTPYAGTLMSVLMCPPDGGIWSVLTCVLGFVAMMILDGVCLSLFLYDSRVGMTEQVSSPMPALEHLAVIGFCHYFIETFSCAYINRYGFRYCLFFGSTLSVTWITLLKLFVDYVVDELPFGQFYYFFLAAVGGIGIGMVKMAFVVLLSSLFVVKREFAHLCLHMGSFTGMLLIPPFTEFLILNGSWQSSMYLHLGLTSFTLMFWLLVATPVPLYVCEETSDDENLHHLSDDSESDGIVDTVADIKLRFVPLTVETQLCGSCRPYVSVGLNANWLYANKTIRRMCVRNLTNMFKGSTIGARPMYQQDIMFDGNVMVLAANLKALNRFEEFSAKMISVVTIDDINEEKYNRCNLCSIAVTRVLKSMFNMSIWLDGKFVVLAASNALIYSSCLLPVLFIKGTAGQKTSAEAMITLIACCFGLLIGRGIGFYLHETSSKGIPLYHVSSVLIANGLSMIVCCTTNDFSKIILFFGCYGFLWGYYKSMQYAVFQHCIFPLKKFTNIRGQISLVRAVSSCAGLMTAIIILEETSEIGYVYEFAGLLTAAGGVCLGLLEPVCRRQMNAANKVGSKHPNIVFDIKTKTLREIIIV
ncbi:Major facilitator superfamily domain [Cinara cedri]|uniref:Major facilitator superfamily domain n=1 Tax=Cinara cedri TaxID=506608 RepID=A0A5E4LY47_9HEMI|nr:Major facilitator superfamily domain [Cinara cedri]